MKYNNVLCIYPYKTEIHEFPFCPPLGLEYIAAAMQDLVDKITLIDMRFENDVTQFLRNETDFVCISVNWDFEKNYVYEIINKIPPHILTVVGGRYATESVVELFQTCPNIDIIVRGDGEETVRELIERGSPYKVKGLSYREHGKIVHNENRILPPVSNTLYPNRKLRRYRYRISAEGVDLGIELDSICTSRGCPFNCKFCYLNINPYGKKRRRSARTPESVIEELKTIDADLIGLVDDNFACDMDRVDKICELIMKERPKKKFIAQVRIDVVKRPDVLRKMYRAGFKLLMLGIESTRDESLKLLNKGFTVRDIREAFKVLRRFNFISHGFFILGNVGESEDDMLYISKFAGEIGVDALSLMHLRVEKYSPMRDLIMNSKGYHIAKNMKVYSDRYPLDKLKEIRRRINTEFYSIPHMLKVLRKLIMIRTIGVTFTFRLLQFIVRKQVRKLLKGSGENGVRSDFSQGKELLD